MIFELPPIYRIARVDISLDNGITWEPATTLKGETKDDGNRYWSWFLWTYNVQSMPSPCRIVCRACKFTQCKVYEEILEFM